MRQLANWVLGLAVDGQRARDLVHPHAADSPVVLHCLVVFTAAFSAWLRWDTAPTLCMCPTLDLLSRVLDTTSVMTMGAMILPDLAFLDRPLEITPARLAMEMETVKAEFRNLNGPLMSWRREAPGHLGAGLDRLTLAVIQACQELAYYETIPILTVVSENLERWNGIFTDVHLRVPPQTPALRVYVTPTAGSDGAPVTTMSRARVAEETARLQAVALQDTRDAHRGLR